jgi:hypothetical protein
MPLRPDALRLLCLLATLGLAPAVPAALAPSGIELDPRATVVEHSEEDLARLHDVPVGRLARAEDVTQGRSTRTVRGTLEGWTWAYPRGVDPADVFARLRRQLPDEAWFECQGMDCGISAIWAHDVFAVADLYGRDRRQQYAAVPRATSGGPTVVLLYVSERGTREVFAHLEEIRLATDAEPGGDADLETALRRALEATGVARLPRLPLEPDGDPAGAAGPILEALALAVAALPPARELWIVVHGRAAEPADSLEVTRRQAEGIVEALGARLPERRLRPVGVGMAVPAVLEDAERVVEIVLPEES